MRRQLRHQTWSAITIAVIASFSSFSANAETGTLTLDTLSFISFQDNEVLLLPPGSTVQFEFSAPDSNGSIAFTISPTGIAIAPVDVPSLGRSLSYGLSSPATGVIRPTPTGRVIEFDGNVSATLSGSDGTTFVYPIEFTTETAYASDALGHFGIEVTGLRLVEGVWYAQIVGGTTNHDNAFPEPGAAVYSVLSGQFDQLPVAP